jgi:Class II flagellar assembly regulator
MLNKITGYGSIKSTGVKKPSGTTASTAFSELLESAAAEETSPPAPLFDVSATTAVNNMLALQEISEDDVKRRKLVQQGKNMLDVLENLRRQLLAGAIPAHTLVELGRQLSIEKQLVADPKLIEIMDDIELRVAVERAKLEAAFSNGD